MINKTKYLIVGAGISGLSFANFIHDNDYTIIESDPTPGGLCKTTYRNGFVWDYSGHFFHFNNPEIKQFFMNVIDQKSLVENIKCTKIYFKGQLIDYPFQKNIHQLPKEDCLDCIYELFFRNDQENYTNFLEMLYAKFGKGIVERFLKPYNEKLYATDLNKLDPQAMGRFFPYATTEEIISNFKKTNNASYNGSFIYHKEGAFAFVKALLKNVDTSKIIYNKKIVKIDKAKKIAFSSDHEMFQYDHLICTAPFSSALKMIDGEVNPVLSANTVIVYNLGFDGPAADTSIHWIYYPEKEYVFYRVGFYNNIMKQPRMSLYVEIGQNDSFPNQDATLDRVINDLKKVNIVSGQKLVDYEQLKISPAYVHISNVSTTFVCEKLKEYAKSSIYALGRYGKWEYSSIEDAVISAKKLAETLALPR